jgi:hypothetical protein
VPIEGEVVARGKTMAEGADRRGGGGARQDSGGARDVWVVVHGGEGATVAPGSGLVPVVATTPRNELGFEAGGRGFVAGNYRGGWGGDGETGGGQLTEEEFALREPN